MMKQDSIYTFTTTVQDILSLLEPYGARLIAGHKGLHRKVTWAMSMHTRLPAFDKPEGGELALISQVSMQALQSVDPLITLPKIIQDLHEAEISAIAVASSESLCKEEITVAEQCAIPLIHLPASTVLAEVERDVITTIVERRGEAEHLANGIYRSMLGISIQGEGIAGITRHLAILVGKAVIVEDKSLHIKHIEIPDDFPFSVEDLNVALDSNKIIPSNFLSEHESAGSQSLGVLKLKVGEEYERIVSPINIKQDRVGYLSILHAANMLDSMDRLVLSQVLSIFTLEFAREREIAEVEYRLQSSVIHDLLSPQLNDEKHIQTRAKQLGIDIEITYIPVLLDMDQDFGDRSSEMWNVQKDVINECHRIISNAVVTPKDRYLLVLIPVIEPLKNIQKKQDEVQIIERLRKKMESLLRKNISAGVGRHFNGIEGLREAYKEAEQALNMGRELFGFNKTTHFGSLGIFRLLFHLHGTDDLRLFYNEVLGSLIEYDQATDSNFVQTLDSFFRCNGNLSETAREMHLHRNSLIYRLDRIQEIIGTSLEDPNIRLSLQVALKIRQTFNFSKLEN